MNGFVGFYEFSEFKGMILGMFPCFDCMCSVDVAVFRSQIPLDYALPLDKMSQSSENQADSYELRPRDNPNHTECSRVGEMSIFSIGEPVTREPIPPSTQVPACQVVKGSAPEDAPAVAERVEMAYQVDTRIPLPGDQVFLPRIEAGSTDPDLTPGYTAAPRSVEPHMGLVKCDHFLNRMIAGVEPSVSLFSALFTVTLEDFQTTFRSHLHRNILAGKCPNKVPDTRLFKKCFFAREDMAIGVPHIWTLKDEAKPLPFCTGTDIEAVDKIRSAIPQDTETTRRLPWYTFVDEVMLVLAGLVYDKEFDPEAKDDPPTWDELMIITSSSQMEEVDFDKMLGRPSFFYRIKIASKTKPRESLVPSTFAPVVPLTTTTIHAPQVRPMLKKIADDIPIPLC
ncbi:hypothetical protein LIER_09238 [Lithospermum erythrorhizon]|uniref:Uncharacterized protein n=1 Tax=Lithospermum erythrorhizon TaxID=34254 RepID=A0AAV3PEZ5_LITER